MFQMAEGQRIRVLIADDHALLRQGLRRILEMESEIQVIGEASDGDQAIDLAVQLQPDVVLMDINMPRRNGLEATREVARLAPGVHVIALTIHDDDEYIFEMVNAGAKGYVLKDADPASLVEAIVKVGRGGAFLTPNLMARVLAEFRRLSDGREVAASTDEHGSQGVPERGLQGNDGSPANVMQKGAATDGTPQTVDTPLTEREQEVLCLIVQGKTNREIAVELFITEKTVKNHVTNMLRKLDMVDRTQAAVYAVRKGLAGGE